MNRVGTIPFARNSYLSIFVYRVRYLKSLFYYASNRSSFSKIGTCVQNNRSFFACERYIFSKNKHLTSKKSLKHVWQLTITTSNVTLEVPLLLLSEKCQNVVFFLVYKSLYSVQIREYTDQKKLRIWTLFTQCTPLLKPSTFLFQTLIVPKDLIHFIYHPILLGKYFLEGHL